MVSGMQDLFWYQLPMKWMVGTSELQEIAWSLADLFNAAGSVLGVCEHSATRRRPPSARPATATKNWTPHTASCQPQVEPLLDDDLTARLGT